MNKARRAVIRSIVDQLQKLTAEIEETCQQEQDYYDAMPESFQDGAKGEAATAVVSALEAAIADIESAISSCEEAIGE